MKTRYALLALAALLLLPAAADAFQVTGRFLYEDRLYDGSGYSGGVQNLPIRHARVEIVDATTQAVLGSGVTGDDGRYDVEVAGQVAPVSFFARCITDGRPAGYEIRVVDTFVRDFATGSLLLTGSSLYSISTSTEAAHDPATDHDFGDFLIQDPDGTGVAQAFNIFDNGVDFFDWMAQPGILGRLPNPGEFVVYGWTPNGANQGSNYSLQGIFIGASPTTDTDGWSDTVIQHETGHWYDDVFTRSDNPGGSHFIGDNNQNPLLSYGEGIATVHCAKVREWRALNRTNLLGAPVDDLVSLYADLGIPPPVGTPGALEFSYDFETGNFADDGTPIGQRGSANETNVTSAIWDMLDGPGTPDGSPGVDDDGLEAGDDVAWSIENGYLRSLPGANPVTVEDYYQGWFAVQGAGFELAAMEHIFVTLALMPFDDDAFEPDDALAAATAIVPLAHAVSPTGGVVINELDLGVQDAVELYNATPDPIDITSWEIEVYINGVTNDQSRIFVFPTFVLGPGEVVAVHERGDPLENGQFHLYAGDGPGLFNMSWFHGGDGACVLRDSGAQPVDFVKWRASDGTPNSTPVPAGTAYTGDLDSPIAPDNLGRDVSGTDTDTAADWSSIAPSLGSANHPSPQAHTIFDVGDVDLLSFSAVAGTRYGFEARGPFSASDPRIELLDSGGGLLASNDDMDPSVRDARMDFFASNAGTFHIRVSHVGPFTDWAEYELLAFERPVATVFQPPSGLTATAENQADTGDRVDLAWSNSGLYDEVRVYRDDVLIATLSGSPSSHTDFVDRGLYKWEVSGVVESEETGRAGDFEFAGTISCWAEDTFEQGNADLWIREGSTWDVTPTHAADGSFGFTDSPVGTYQGCPQGGGCSVNAIAVFSVPSRLPEHGGVLEFDQICITEATFDFGIVEISTDDGGSWTELARYDQNSDPAWQDNVANPDDWRMVSLPLTAFGNEEVLVRFRLESDQLLELDGWYLDNVRINDISCSEPVPALVRSIDAEGVEEGVRIRLETEGTSAIQSAVVYRGADRDRASRVILTPEPLPTEANRFEYLDATLPAGEGAWYWVEAWDTQGRVLEAGPVYGRAAHAEVAVTFAAPAAPNPVTTGSVFAFALGTDLAADGPVEVSYTIHDPRGRVVKTLHRGLTEAGTYRLTWDGTDDGGARLGAGVYFARFRAGTHFQNAQVTLLR